MRAAPSGLDASYRNCIEITRERARNFHYALKMLPQERYKSMCALYAFARVADDLSDDEPDPVKSLANTQGWRAAFDKALAGDCGEDRVLPAVSDTVKRYEIPPQYLYDLLAGTEMDASVKRFPVWADTYLYCYRVASVVGMMTVRVFGFTGDTARAMELAERTGIAFQMTNIIRDMKEDAGRDRIYLPQEDLARFGVGEAEVLAAKDAPAYRKLLEFEGRRAQEYYAAADELIPMILPESRPAMEALVAIYRRLLEEIERRGYDVFTKRVSLSTAEKLKLAGRFALKSWLKR